MRACRVVESAQQRCIERALVDGVQAFAPGLLARANRGFLYIDEVNLLEDHLVDLLLDVATSGVNVVEREVALFLGKADEVADFVVDASGCRIGSREGARAGGRRDFSEDSLDGFGLV